MSISEAPQRPPILPPAINDAVFAPKRRMAEIRLAAEKRLKKHRGKFERLVRKYVKKHLEDRERYLQFYDIGYRFEAVFCEIRMDGLDFHGTPLAEVHARALAEHVTGEMKLPTGFEAIIVRWEKNQQGGYMVMQLVAESEEAEIKRLQAQVEGATRSNNPGM